MLKNFFVLGFIGVLGLGLGVSRFLQNDKLAESENYSISGELALKQVELEKIRIENVEREEGVEGGEEKDQIFQVHHLNEESLQNSALPDLNQLETDLTSDIQQLQRAQDAIVEWENSSILHRIVHSPPQTRARSNKERALEMEQKFSSLFHPIL